MVKVFKFCSGAIACMLIFGSTWASLTCDCNFEKGEKNCYAMNVSVGSCVPAKVKKGDCPCNQFSQNYQGRFSCSPGCASNANCKSDSVCWAYPYHLDEGYSNAERVCLPLNTGVKIKMIPNGWRIKETWSKKWITKNDKISSKGCVILTTGQ